MTDFDNSTYSAFYNRFKVGPGDGYELTIGGYQSSVSTLNNGMKQNNGMRFSTRDKDQDGWKAGNCARSYGGGGWWYANCGNVRPTGLHKKEKYSRRRDRTMLQILFISPREKEETLMTVGPELSLFLYQIMKKNKRPIYPIKKKKPPFPPQKKKKKKKKS